MVTVLPEIVTCEVSPIAMVRVSPAPLLMTMFPVPAATASLKVSTMLLPAATSVALSAGVAAVSVGPVVSVSSAAVTVRSANSNLSTFVTVSMPSEAPVRLSVKTNEPPCTVTV